jgi:hypothetical protein
VSRGISTAVDVALAALVVSGALVVLASLASVPPPNHGTDAADETTDLLGSTTTSVNYTLSPGARAADEYVDVDETSGPEFRRYAHGTLADLLGRAAVADARLDRRELTRTHEDFERAVRAETRATVAGADARVQVRAVWRPYRGAPLAGGVVVGDSPPEDVTVHAATTQVSAPVPATQTRALAAADGGYGAVARVVAEGTIRGLFDPEQAWLALRGDEPVSTLITYRYRRTATLLDVADSVDASLSTYGVEGANEALTEALVERFEADMRDRYATPAAAAESVSTGVVVITVRTWSP